MSIVWISNRDWPRNTSQHIPHLKAKVATGLTSRNVNSKITRQTRGTNRALVRRQIWATCPGSKELPIFDSGKTQSMYCELQRRQYFRNFTQINEWLFPKGKLNIAWWKSHAGKTHSMFRIATSQDDTARISYRQNSSGCHELLWCDSSERSGRFWASRSHWKLSLHAAKCNDAKFSELWTACIFSRSDMRISHWGESLDVRSCSDSRLPHSLIQCAWIFFRRDAPRESRIHNANLTLEKK